MPGHAVEVIHDGESWYASAAGWFRNGLYVAPLSWRDTPPPWQSPDNPVAGLDVDGRLTVFALAPGGTAVDHRWQEAPGGPWTGSWHRFGTAAGAAPRVTGDGSGRLTVTAIGPSGVGTFVRRQAVPSGGWQPWTAFGDRTVAPLVSGSPAL
ncbi:hypothetical protein [Streptomyces microflavus]|uniref:hypothetical protein n=1 Tax=Streptomyces microflavus TaxID=1919 RepID=UPI0033DAC834